MNVALMRTDESECVRCRLCGQALAIRIGPNQYRALGADVVSSYRGRQVFICPVPSCRARTRVLHEVDDKLQET